MKTFPMFLRMTGRKIVILGGGEQAAQKCRLALKTEAEIVLAAADTPDDELTDLIDQGRITYVKGPVSPGLFDNSALVFIATGCAQSDITLHAIAKSAGALVNVVDQPELCDAITPSIVDRDPVVVAIGTEGTAPVLARQIKSRVEEMLEPQLGGLAALAGRLRTSAAQHLTPLARRNLWRWVFNDAPRQAYCADSERDAARMIKSAIINGGAPQEAHPSISLISTGQGGRDMISLRAVKRLQEADTIFYAELEDENILELARRDSQRVAVNLDCQPDRLAGLLNRATANGQRVVWLTSNCINTCITAKNLSQNLAATGHTFERIPGANAQVQTHSLPQAIAS